MPSTKEQTWAATFYAAKRVLRLMMVERQKELEASPHIDRYVVLKAEHGALEVAIEAMDLLEE